MFDISTWFVNVEPLEDKLFGKSDHVFLIVTIDFITFHVFLILFILASKHWLSLFVLLFLRRIDNTFL